MSTRSLVVACALLPACSFAFVEGPDGAVWRRQAPVTCTTFGMAACGLVKGEYLLGTGLLRPFAGLGAGVYSMGSHTIVIDAEGNSGISTTTGRYFGVAPAVGVDHGRIRLAATYNAIVGTGVEYRQTTGGVEQRETFPQSYLSLELSFRFGGGRKRAVP